MSIIQPILVDVYKHFEIFYAQLRVLKVGAYTCHIKNF
jgi:hypothetical protein